MLADRYEIGGHVIVLDVSKGNTYEEMLECSGVKNETPLEDFFARLASFVLSLDDVMVQARPNEELVARQLAMAARYHVSGHDSSL